MLAGISLLPIGLAVFSAPTEAAAAAGWIKAVDWLGAALFTLGITLFTFSLTQSGVDPKGWAAPCEWRRWSD